MGTTLTITPPADYNGSEDITVVVTDGDLSDSTTFTLTVNPVNDAPVVANPIDDIIADEDSDAISIDLSTVFDDVENGSNLSFSFSENVAAVEASLDGSVLTLNFLENENGSGSVTVSASDVVSRLSVQDSFDVTVTPVNDAPVADATSAAGDEDSNISIDLSGSDIDGDALTFSLGSGASNGSVDVSGSTATYTPNSDFNGSDSFTFVASDGELSSEATVDVTVNPVNDAPTLDDLADASVAEDTDFTLELSGADVDGDALTFLASVDANGSVAVDGSTLTVSPASDYNGDITVSVIASDGQASGSGSFTLTVTPVNDAPVIGALDNQSIDEDGSLTLDLSG